MSNSEFARKQLKKHGWKEGSGLGKEEHGRADPIKVNLKMDKTGVGHDPGKEFTDHWWLRVFNEAAQKIGTKEKKTESTPKTEEEEAKSKKEQQRRNFYKGFVQSATLTNGVEEKLSSSDTSDEDEKDASNAVSVPTLEDIHKFCGGATGHKAASFGIRMEGKIKRASHHEKQFEEKAKRNGLIDETTTPSLDDDSLDLGNNKRKQKKKKKRKEEKCEDDGPEIIESKKSSKRKLEVEDSALDNEAEHQDSEPAPTKKSKKKKRNKSEKTVLGSELTEVSEPSEDAKSEVVIDHVNDGCNDETKKEKTEDPSHDEEFGTGSKNCKKKKKKKKKTCD